MSVSVSRGSPVTTSTQSLDDGQVCFGFPHLAYLTAPTSGHLFPFSYSPTSHPVTRSVVNEPTAHITVRLCQAITAIPVGYYENSGTVSLSAFRPSHVPLRRNVLAQLRCPIHDLEYPHWVSPIVQGVPRAKLVPVAHDGAGVQTCYRRVCSFHRWSLGFGQSGSHHIALALQDHAIHIF